MKRSNYGLFYIILGFALFIFTVTLSLILNDQVRSPTLLAIGLGVMNLFWIMGLEIDILRENKCQK